MAKLHGIFAVQVTHFTDSGAIDYAANKKHTQWLLDSGVHGLLPLGATGEFASFSLEERQAFAEFIVKEAAGRVPVCIGAVSQNIDTVYAVATHAAQIGASAIMSLIPPGLHLNQEEVYAFFKDLSEKVSLPVMVYNNPGSAGVDIEPATMARIAALPHMDYLKESTGDIKRLTLMTDTLSDKITTFCGCEDMAYESFVMGAQGWVCVLANIAPKMSVQLFDLITKQQNLSEARVIYRQVLPFLRLFEASGQLWQVVKYILTKQGFGTGICRSPRQAICPEVKAEADKLLASTKLY